jgi:hypothetical protein
MRLVSENVLEWRWDPKGEIPARTQTLTFDLPDNPTITFPPGPLRMGELRAVQPVRDALAALVRDHGLTMIQVQW